MTYSRWLLIEVKSYLLSTHQPPSPPPPLTSSLPPPPLLLLSQQGAAERFRYTDDGYLYSPLMGGMFTCRAGEIITGFPYSSSRYSNNYNKFKFHIISDQKSEEALELVHLSDRLITIQSQYIEDHKATPVERKAAASMIVSSDNPNPVRICIGIPMTSKGTKMSSVKDSPLWTNFFDSFMKSVDWRSNRYIFRVYLGLDKKDDLYDTGDAWSEIREEFKSRAIYRMKEQLMETTEIEEVLDKQLSLKLMHFDHLEGAPSQVVSQLMLGAYVDNYDYFYQVNDDTIIVTPNWAPKFIEVLAANPAIPNFGVTGEEDGSLSPPRFLRLIVSHTLVILMLLTHSRPPQHILSIHPLLPQHTLFYPHPPPSPNTPSSIPTGPSDTNNDNIFTHSY